MRALVRGFASILAFVAKEILEVVRSPAALISLTTSCRPRTGLG